MPEKLAERLQRQLAECHKALLLTADDLVDLAQRLGPAEQQQQCLKAAELLRRFVGRQQKEGR